MHTCVQYLHVHRPRAAERKLCREAKTQDKARQGRAYTRTHTCTAAYTNNKRTKKSTTRGSFRRFKRQNYQQKRLADYCCFDDYHDDFYSLRLRALLLLDSMCAHAHIRRPLGKSEGRSSKWFTLPTA